MSPSPVRRHQHAVVVIAAALVNPAHIDVTPTLVVEMSSPSTRRLDLIAKRALYERREVPVYWFVDLDVDQVDVHVLRDGRYGAPRSYEPGATLTLDGASRLAQPVAYVLAG
ncbi:MAG: Uma2 family endonuclease [Actinobacteria bacterium]|nr:Uma2 family endonuclease [Actinomycetota bacterium]